MRIGVDLGGTKIEALAIDDSGAEVARRRVTTPSGGVVAIVEAVAELVRSLEAKIRARATVGVGTPGALHPDTGLLQNSNTVCLNETPLLTILEEALERPVRLANDANCFALSEAIDGAGAGAEVVFGVILGTGTGGGIVVHERVLRGPHAVAGEWGHNPLPWAEARDEPPPPCYCGRSGCLETYLSGPGIARDHEQHTGEALDARTIGERAALGDPAAVATLARHRDRLGRGLAAVVNLLDPDVVVLGGGVSNLEGLAEALPPLVARHAFTGGLRTAFRVAHHGDASGVRGAAWLWERS
jgi:fructokinase